ncbi:hydroxyacylglutathione hydrolase [Aerococcus kribbianus]|uniref:Hydroxyacylglutathione hydrolase n=1 Tax=Aerococcus kribbianus TaxID=2999064 RepID=A0A9X3FQB4_9LACT|nr:MULTISPECIES: hydroxyacylglutathione hydrolase [unclassified Aerococcus]MCZ0718100.1 hydroxyacylglutathione hydrolase [Aerococcus sp. YH-aer221]MCZ0726331.1 hydroxyacylglutathione hydrolase [Aerococcus sp. YH-aer222]
MITAIPALADNYIWTYIEDGQAVIVDPGESQGVLDFLAKEDVDLAYILLTHGHSDHVDGVADLRTAYPNVQVIGPSEVAEQVDKVVAEGDTVPVLKTDYQVFKAAGHTQEHIVYLSGDVLFAGDALFAGGCGRVFTQDYQAAYQGMKKFNALADSVRLYAGHEYTMTNLKFAQTILGDQAELEKAIKRAQDHLDQGQPTLPTTLGEEKTYNVFLQAQSLEDFIHYRKQRDNF